MNKKIFLLLTVTLLGTQTWAGSITIPNTFTDGTTASAGEVNANFDTVEGAINDNDSSITTNTLGVQTNASDIGINSVGIITNASVGITNTADIQTNVANIGINTSNIQTDSTNISINTTDIQANTIAIGSILASKNLSVFGDGIRIGTFVHWWLGNSFTPSVRSYFYTLSDTNYLAKIPATGYTELQSNYMAAIFSTTDCTGQAYIRTSFFGYSNETRFLRIQGAVFKTVDVDPVNTRYVKRDAVAEAVTYGSEYNYLYATCHINTSTPLPLSVYKLQPNEPIVTGFQDSVFDSGVFSLGY